MQEDQNRSIGRDLHPTRGMVRKTVTGERQQLCRLAQDILAGPGDDHTIGLESGDRKHSLMHKSASREKLNGDDPAMIVHPNASGASGLKPARDLPDGEPFMIASSTEESPKVHSCHIGRNLGERVREVALTLFLLEVNPFGFGQRNPDRIRIAHPKIDPRTVIGPSVNGNHKQPLKGIRKGRAHGTHENDLAHVFLLTYKSFSTSAMVVPSSSLTSTVNTGSTFGSLRALLRITSTSAGGT